MNLSSMIGLVHNIALLLALAVIFDLFTIRKKITPVVSTRLLTGIVIGLTGVAIMMSPWVLIPGVVFDTRSVLLGISGLFFGLIPTIVAMIITAIYRLILGGDGTLMGVSVIIASGTIGILARYFRKKQIANLNWKELYLFGILIHVVMMVLVFTLPREIAFQTFKTIGLPVILIYPVGTALLGLLLVHRLNREMTKDNLRRSETLLNSTQQITRVGGWEWDVEKKEVYWTEEVFQIHEIDSSEFPNGSPELFDKSIACYAPEGRAYLLEAFQKCQETGEPYNIETEFTTVQGKQLWVRTIGEAQIEDNKVVRIIGNIMDITEQKAIEQTLREREAYIKTVLDNLPLGIAVNSVEPEVNFTYINDNFVKFYRTIREKLSHPDAFWNVVYEDAEFREQIKKRVQNDITSNDQEKMIWEDIPITRKGEETTFISARNIPLQEKGMAISTVWDVTDRKRAEDALRESESKFRGIFENNHSVMMLVDPETETVIEANPAASAYYGWTASEFVGKKVSEINTLTEEEIKEEIQNVLTKKRNYFQFKHRLANDEIRDVEVFSGPIQNQGKVMLFSIVHDISARKMAETALMQKMDELVRFQQLTIGRELKMIELKHEVDTLLVQSGKEEKYKIAE